MLVSLGYRKKRKPPCNDVSSSYYAWLKTKICNITYIPEDKQNDKKFLLSFLIDYPAAITQLPSDIQNDHAFMLDLYGFENNLVKYCRELSKDQVFMLKAIKVSDFALLHADSELFKSKEFMMQALETNEEVYLSRAAILKRLSPELKQDPDILKRLEKRSN